MSEPNIRRAVLANGVRLATERMPHVRSVAVGIWLTRGSRHEPAGQHGHCALRRAHALQGHADAIAEEIAQQVDSIGGQIDAFTSKEYAGYYLKVLDEHLPLAVDILADLISNPLMADDDIEKEKKVILEEIKMVEDTPDDLVHEIFAEGFWSGHPLGRPILGTPASVNALNRDDAHEVLRQHLRRRELRRRRRRQSRARPRAGAARTRAGAHSAQRPRGRAHRAPVVAPTIQIRKKELEQSHVVFGTPALPQHHPERYAGYALNTTLGGSMSSRLFQNVREKRGLAYAVFSGLSAYQDAGALSIYAGCGNDAVAELIDVVVAEIRQMKAGGLDPIELRRAKDHLKGSLMLGLESTSSRMSHLARQEMYRDRTDGLDEMLASIERVTAEDVLRLADRFFANGSLAVTVLGNVNGLQVTQEQLAL